MIKPKEKPGALHIRGISSENLRFLKKYPKKINYTSKGEFLNKIIDRERLEVEARGKKWDE